MILRLSLRSIDRMNCLEYRGRSLPLGIVFLITPLAFLMLPFSRRIAISSRSSFVRWVHVFCFFHAFKNIGIHLNSKENSQSDITSDIISTNHSSQKSYVSLDFACFKMPIPATTIPLSFEFIAYFTVDKCI